MDAGIVQTELPALLGQLLGVPCDWRDEERTLRDGDAVAAVDMIACPAIGVDERIMSNVEDPNDEDNPLGVVATIIGQREPTFQVSVWTASQRIGKNAAFFVERLRTRIRLPENLEALKRIGFALVAIEAPVNTDPEEDGRIRSQSTIDLRLATTSEEVGELLSYISSVRNQSGTTGGDGITQPSGDPSPIQIDFTVGA